MKHKCLTSRLGAIQLPGNVAALATKPSIVSAFKLNLSHLVDHKFKMKNVLLSSINVVFIKFVLNIARGNLTVYTTRLRITGPHMICSVLVMLL